MIYQKIYEKVADKYLENKLTAPSARDLFFKSLLLHLANDVEDFTVNFYFV
jgi:alpha-soluble NSF attachment protein